MTKSRNKEFWHGKIHYGYYEAEINNSADVEEIIKEGTDPILHSQSCCLNSQLCGCLWLLVLFNVSQLDLFSNISILKYFQYSLNYYCLITISAQRNIAGPVGISDMLISLEVTSADVPDLTLIDLPGIVRVPMKGQPEDIGEQKIIVRYYLMNCICYMVCSLNMTL